jgi:hypothetical protein
MELSRLISGQKWHFPWTVFRPAAAAATALDLPCPNLLVARHSHRPYDSTGMAEAAAADLWRAAVHGAGDSRRKWLIKRGSI